MTSDFTLAELLICACADVWRGDGEVLATGIGIIPRLAQGLAKLTHSPCLMITDGEAYLVEEPVAIGAKTHEGRTYGGWMPYSRVFDNVWGGRRHALVGPVQVDRWGQANISCVGDFAKPKRQLLGLRGFPGNSINHANSFFVPNHGPRVFVDKEVDVVCSVGYRKERWAPGVKNDYMRIHHIVTDGWSGGILADELGAAIEQRRRDLGEAQATVQSLAAARSAAYRSASSRARRT